MSTPFRQHAKVKRIPKQRPVKVTAKVKRIPKQRPVKVTAKVKRIPKQRPVKVNRFPPLLTKASRRHIVIVSPHLGDVGR